METRGIKGLVLRASEGRAVPTIVGMPIVFGQPSQPLFDLRHGEFVEMVAPSFADGLANGDARALVDHDAGKVIGRQSAGTLRIETTREGVRVEIDPPETTAGRDIVESIRRGDVDGMSFGFSDADDEWEDRDGMPHRTLTGGHVAEFSIVAWPAYPQTSVDVRSFGRWKESGYKARMDTVRKLRRLTELL